MPLRKLSQGGCAGVGGGQETLKPGRFPRVEPLIDWVKPHTGGGPTLNVPMLQHIF
jgi:hypothetical protein